MTGRHFKNAFIFKSFLSDYRFAYYEFKLVFVSITSISDLAWNRLPTQVMKPRFPTGHFVDEVMANFSDPSTWQFVLHCLLSLGRLRERIVPAEPSKVSRSENWVCWYVCRYVCN